MSGWEILFIGIALSMDAFAAALTDGMVEPRMGAMKMLVIALAFGLFQFFMPLIGYFFGAAFFELVAKIAPYLSFALLLLLGGKTVQAGVLDLRRKKQAALHPFLEKERTPLGAWKLLVQSVATSLDALAVGVTLLAAETGPGLPFSVYLCTLVIGVTTFSLSAIALSVGKKAGGILSEGAEIPGGVILILIGIKILLEGIL